MRERDQHMDIQRCGIVRGGYHDEFVILSCQTSEGNVADECFVRTPRECFFIYRRIEVEASLTRQ
jgi:hypothetical protein